MTRIAFSLSCFLSRWADLVVANSTAGAAYHVRRGYPRSTMRVVHNGIDTRRFISSPPARRSFREAWGIGSDDLLVGLVARIDPVKGHRYFLRCAASYARANPAARFVCIGSGNSVLSSELRASAEARELAHRLVWVDESLDMPGVYSALDILASCSASEGFSNVLGEAMACGVPCAVTDVGDSRAIVADLGEVVPVGDVEAMVAAWSRLAARRSPALSEDCRRRVEQEYSIERMVTATLDLFVNGAK